MKKTKEREQKICARPGCENELRTGGPGREPRYCSSYCRVRDWRRKQKEK